MSLASASSDRSSDSSSSSSSPTERKNADFSISAILSNDTGSSSRKIKVTPVRGQEHRTSTGVLISPPGLRVPVSTPSRYNTHLHSSPLSSYFTPTTATPTPHWAQGGALNQSLSSSPFNISLLLLASSPTASEVEGGQSRMGVETNESGGDRFSCNDSLGMLSTVAMYHSELSGGEGKEGEREVGSGQGGERSAAAVVMTVGDGMARMRLESSCDTADTTLSDRRSTPPPSSPSSPSSHARTRGKGTTPFILKRDRKRRRQLTGSFTPHVSSSTEVPKTTTNPCHSLQPPPPTHPDHPVSTLDTGFLSPTSTQHSPHHTNLSFSPSIFLRRPVNTSSSSDQSTNRSLGMEKSLLPGEAHSTTNTLPTSEVAGGRRDARVACESSGNRTSAEVSANTAREGGDERKREEESAECSSSVPMDGDQPTVQVSSFVTSTPIKRDKENTRATGLHPPTYYSPTENSGEIKRPRLRDPAAYETSSGSDSEVPVKKYRSQGLRRRSKARAQLSPLLENACSPIAKSDHRPPSSLLTANFPTSTSSATDAPHNATELQSKIPVQDPRHHPSFPMTPTTPKPPISMPCLPPQVPTIPFPFSCNTLPPPFHTQLPQQPNLCLGMMPVAPNPLFPMSVSPLSPPPTSYFVPPRLPVVSPTTAGHLHPSSSFYYYNAPHRAYNYPTGTTMGNMSQRWGGSPLSSQWEKTGQIQSVPPWFIFEQNRPEGKRLRLTEAINRSLSETPSHNPKLPAEWTKYACGQTDDQRMLTQKARQFLQSGRRQLTFDNINP